MTTAFWAVALGVAVLWPARFAGLLDGAPLDSAVDAVVIGLALPALIWFRPEALRASIMRGLIVALLAWKAATAVAVSQDGWCLRFTSPQPLFVDGVTVPHSWDIRADWRAAVPQCSAVMARGYADIEHFPAWFYNLPPDNFRQAAQNKDRPPNVTTRFDLTGYLHVDEPGTFSIVVDEGVRLDASIDGSAQRVDVVRGIQLPSGLHSVAVAGELSGSHWRLQPSWNGTDLWTRTVATMSAPSALDRAMRPWAGWVAAVMVAAIAVVAAMPIVRMTGLVIVAPVVASAVVLVAALSGRTAFMRVTPLLLVYAAFMPLPRRLQNVRGMLLLLGLPFLILFAVLGAPQAGVFTWYSSGDDWWMFQRFAYRVYLQGYWLEGGEPAFWFQPFYRWIAGALHLVFGDSSVGELFWDAACTLAGAVFAFQMARVTAGFRWGIAAAVTTLTLMLLGPAWYLFGRGLSEITSAGFLYAAALFAMQGRHGHVPSIVMAGILAVLAFYTRLNNLPAVLALAAFAWAPSQPVMSIRAPARLIATASRPVLLGLTAAIAVGLWLFTARTYYYTGVPSMLHGTQAGHLSVWQLPDGGGSIADNVIGSILMMVTMSDPPRLDVRAVPIIAGVVAAFAALAGVARLRCLPIGTVAMCLAGFSGALVARGTAYPGRFSVHIIPVTAAIAIAAIALVAGRANPRACGRSRLP